MPRKSFPFWRFSLRVYSRAGVEQTCLAMQEAGADVNLLLFCCWQGSEGISLNKDLLQQTIRSVAAWQQKVVQPLRQARRTSKQELPGVPSELSSSLSRRLAKVELDAEYLEQLLLSQHALTAPQGMRRATPEIIAAANLLRYLELLGIPLSAALKRHAQTLLRASTG